MKRILFYNIEELNPFRGGVHRVTDLLMRNFSANNHLCYYLFIENECFVLSDINGNKQLIAKQDFISFAITMHFDIIIDQQAGISDSFVPIATQLKPYGVKYIPVFHNTPLQYDKTFIPSLLINNFNRSTKIRAKISYLARLLLFPLWKYKVIRGVKRMYSNIYRQCDRLVLLTQGDMIHLQNKIGNNGTSKSLAIPNPLSFDAIAPSSILHQKKECVLIVARLNDYEKRISLALQIWQRIERIPECQNWVLDIVGSGPNEQQLKKLSQKLKLTRVTFHGHRPSEPYYKTASIYMCTSAVEGWGLMLTESMQNGVVPIAFDSYPALRDIITPEYDGCIIPDNDIKLYTQTLQQLMLDNSLRNRMALNGLSSCKRFEISNVVGQWNELIESL